eukprot:1939379-Pleurochrysis_carterae.AAC.1
MSCTLSPMICSGRYVTDESTLEFTFIIFAKMMMYASQVCASASAHIMHYTYRLIAPSAPRARHSRTANLLKRASLCHMHLFLTIAACAQRVCRFTADAALRAHLPRARKRSAPSRWHWLVGCASIPSCALCSPNY